MKTIAFHNLGCKVNSYELDVMQQIIQEKGYQIVPFDQKADIYVINTCTVTNIADRKSRQMLHRAKQKNPEAVVVAVGCYVQTDLEGVKKDPAIDLAIGNNRKKNIAEVLEQFLTEREKAKSEAADTAKKVDKTSGDKAAVDKAAGDKTLGGTSVIDINHDYEYEEMTLKTTAEHTRAYVKIQDGCNQFCSYCAIPLARGRVRSRKAKDVLREIRGIVEAGYKEIVLTGIHVSSYGIDLSDDMNETVNLRGAETAETTAKTASEGENGSYVPRDYRGSSKLMKLIEEIHGIPGLERIRISSLEPRIVTPEIAMRLAALPKVCPHFHLSLQSGCDETLKRMNRHYTAQQYLESVEALRKAYAPRIPAITTDVIVGFPGETEEEFQITKAFLEKVGFYEMHVFKYSKRKGTRAAVMPEQVPDEVKAQRSDVLLELERKQSLAFRRQKLGTKVLVLFEEEKEIGKKTYLLGHTTDYVKVAVPREDDEASRKVDGKMAPKADDKTSQKVDDKTACELDEKIVPGSIAEILLTELLTEEIILGK